MGSTDCSLNSEMHSMQNERKKTTHFYLFISFAIWVGVEGVSVREERSDESIGRIMADTEDVLGGSLYFVLFIDFLAETELKLENVGCRMRWNAVIEDD